MQFTKKILIFLKERVLPLLSIINYQLSILVFVFLAYSPAKAQDGKGIMASANEAYIKYEYATAAKLYEKVLGKNSKNTLVISRLASCYKEMNNYAAAEKYYTQLIAMPGTAPEEWLYFADMLKSTGKYDAAKQIYQQYQVKSGVSIADKIAGCDSASYWIQHPAGYNIENMAYLNTGKSDWGAVFNPATSSVVFVSDSLRNVKSGFFKKNVSDAIYGRTDNNFQKIYAVSDNRNDANANQIHEFDPMINRADYHTGPVVFNSNYDSIFFTMTTEKSGKPNEKVKIGPNGTIDFKTLRLELYLSTLTKTGQWSSPVPFAFNNAAAYSVGHAALSLDGHYLYFTSDMPGGMGGLDIWYCERLITGNWGLPRNCGAAINTKEDEAFPVIGTNSYLYFASKGHVGMGGYDLFVSAGEKNRWTKPKNMGYPLNSSGDDFYYFTKDDTSGFFSSNRKGGKGDDDIYQYIITEPAAPIRSDNVLVLETKVIDNTTKLPISNAALAFWNTSTDTKWDQQTNNNGKAWHDVEDATPYAITAAKQGYYSSIISINTKNTSGDTMRVVIPLDSDGTKPAPRVYRLADTITSLHEGDKFRINNIHYNFDKNNIRPDAAKILDTLVDILHQYPTMVIELSSHTDSRGSDAYNENLADRRAKSAVAYMISRGIDRRRLIAKGYGEYLLLNGCSNGVACTEEEHQANRRTEVKILRF
ncbi:OmpA family protein [Parasediminibacterium sp. JCM 36343]|uniref:OmpA family protein n=1 Tax=Parasediminibacterium sp. JCM 36343 TaxID=3374279 RepID=UPI00397D3532